MTTFPTQQSTSLQHQLITHAHLPYTSTLPTSDTEIKTILRKLQHPICYFAENAMMRRERLARILLQMQEEYGDETLDWRGILGMREENEVQAPEDAQDDFDDDDLFYTEGCEELAAWRGVLWDYSRERAQGRLERELRERRGLLETMKDREKFRETVREGIQERRRLIGAWKKVRLHASQAAQKRPIASISMRASGRECVKVDNKFGDDKMQVDTNDTSTPSTTPNGLVLTGDYNGTVTLWSASATDNYAALREFPASSDHTPNGHEERITGVDFIPTQIRESTLAFATASVDRTAKLWSLNSVHPIATLKAHTDRLARVSFHPSGRLLGTASFDGTWGLWDVEKQQCLLQQEGHSRAVYDIQFHIDGSLAASCDLGGIVRVWDLRSGRSLFHVGAHVRKVLSVAFANNGFQLASASDDNTVKMWDLRSRKFVYRIPAHQRMITRVRFDESSRFLLTSSHDRTVRVWSNGEYKLVRELEGHEGVISDFDVGGSVGATQGQDSLRIVTCGLDRTWKIYE